MFFYVLNILWRWIMGLIRNRNTIKISPTDTDDGYIAEKIIAGENVYVSLENSSCCGQQLVISANKTESRQVQSINQDSSINLDTYLALIDSSKNPVVVTLPKAKDFIGHLQLVCVTSSNAIDIQAMDGDWLFDDSSLNFNNSGDAFILVSDRMNQWFVVGRYNPQWYA